MNPAAHKLAPGGHAVGKLATPAAFDCVYDVGSGHADSEEDTAQLSDHRCLRKMLWVTRVDEHDNPRRQPDSTQGD
jgi:hypothetical protein